MWKDEKKIIRKMYVGNTADENLQSKRKSN